MVGFRVETGFKIQFPFLCMGVLRVVTYVDTATIIDIVENDKDVNLLEHKR